MMTPAAPTTAPKVAPVDQTAAGFAPPVEEVAPGNCQFVGSFVDRLDVLPAAEVA
jgi:hypothetical protein